MTCELGCPKRANYKGEERILVCSDCYPRVEEASSEDYPDAEGLAALRANREPSAAARRLADVIEYVRKQTGPPASEWEHDPATILQAIDRLAHGEDTP